MQDYECPDCGETLEVGDFDVQATCPECQNSWRVDRDGEFTNGAWRDRTKLFPLTA